MADNESSDPTRAVDASPEKRFFIQMLVKDIELVPAILDLVDNSVDGARALKGDDRFDNLFVNLAISAKEFVITDNCGGLEAEVARHYAFRFGRPKAFEGTEGSVGQFGVGMKRALFKLGNEFNIKSDATNSRWEMTVNVPDWATKTGSDWSFEFDQVEDNITVPEESRGVVITVTQLHDSVVEDFETDEFVGRLRSNLRLRHQDALDRGLAMSVNGEPVKPRGQVLLMSDDLRPIKRQRRIGVNGSGVDLTIIAGIAPLPDKDEERDSGDGESFTETSDAGWYLYCNGRLLLAADKTELTGWGRAGAAYHPQYRRFRGYAYLWAKDSSLLPWNTTKTGVDQDSPIMRTVQQEMFSAFSGVLTVLNRMKKERQERPEDDRPLAGALAAARPTAISEVQESEQFQAPEPPPKPPAKPTTVKLQYDIDRDDFDAVKEALGVNVIAEVGRRTFYYYYENEVE